MPTYDYYCENCGFEFEEFQSIGSEPLKKCPECGELSLKRVISGGAGLIFKGSGFYITDYARKADKKGSNGSKSETEKEKKTEKAEKK